MKIKFSKNKKEWELPVKNGYTFISDINHFNVMWQSDLEALHEYFLVSSDIDTIFIRKKANLTPQQEIEADRLLTIHKGRLLQDLQAKSKSMEKMQTQLAIHTKSMPCYTKDKRIDTEKLEKKAKEQKREIEHRRKSKPMRVWVARCALAFVIFAFSLIILKEDYSYRKEVSAKEFSKFEVKINLSENTTKTLNFRNEKDAVKAYIEKKFGKDADKAIDCFSSESGLRAKALNTKNTNGTWDYGVAQINSVHCPKVGTTDKNKCKDIFFDYKKNIDMAYTIYQDRGFNAWFGKSCIKYWK